MKLHLPLGLLAALMMTFTATVSQTYAATAFSSKNKYIQFVKDIPTSAWSASNASLTYYNTGTGEESIFESDASSPSKTRAWVVDLSAPELSAVLDGTDWTINFRSTGLTFDTSRNVNSAQTIYALSAEQYANGYNPETGEFMFDEKTGWRFWTNISKTRCSVWATGGIDVNNDTFEYASGWYSFSQSDNKLTLYKGKGDSRTGAVTATGYNWNNTPITALVIFFTDKTAPGKPKLLNFSIENRGEAEQAHVFTWTGTGNSTLGKNDRDLVSNWGKYLLEADYVSVASNAETETGAQEKTTYNLQEEAFSNIALRRNNDKRRSVNEKEEDLAVEMVNGTFNMMRFVEAGIREGAEVRKTSGNSTYFEAFKYSVGSGVNLKTSQGMGHELCLGGLLVEEGATGYTFSSGYDYTKDLDGKALKDDELEEAKANIKTVVFGSNTADSTAVTFTILENFSLGTETNPWESVKNATGVTAWDINVKSGKVFKLYGKTESDLSFGSITLSGGGTFMLGNGMTFNLTTDGISITENSTLDFDHSDSVGTTSIVMKHGSLKNAENLTNEVTVNVGEDPSATQKKAVFDMGGLKAEYITVVRSPHALRNIGNGTLTLAASGNNSQLELCAAADNFSLSSSGSSTYMFHFKNASGGSVSLDNNTQIDLNFDETTLPTWRTDWVTGNGNELGYVDPVPYEGVVYFWFTNGKILVNGQEMDPNDPDAVNEWFLDHFLIPSFMSELTAVPSISVQDGIESGKFKLVISTAGVWYSSRQGEVINSMKLLDEMGTYQDRDGSTKDFRKWSTVVVDSSLTLNLKPSEAKKDVTLRLLSSTGSTGALTINRNQADDTALTVYLDNSSGQTSKSGNVYSPHTVFNKDIIINDAKHATTLAKFGKGTMTVNGNMRGDVYLSVAGESDTKAEEARLVLNGNSEVLSITTLEGEDNAGNITPGTLVVNGSLSLKEATTLKGASTAPNGEKGILTGSGAIIVQKALTISADRLGKDNTLVMYMNPDATLTVDTTDERTLQLGGLESGSIFSAGGSVDFGHQQAQVNLVSGSSHLFRGALAAGSSASLSVLDSTEQIFWSSGNSLYNLTADNGGAISLIGERSTIQGRASTKPLIAGAEYGDITVAGADKQKGTEAGYLRVSASEWGTRQEGYEAITSVTVNSLSVGAGATVEIAYNFAGADDDLSTIGEAAVVAKSITIDRDANFVLSSLGSSFAIQEGKDIENLAVMKIAKGSDNKITITGNYVAGESLNLDLQGIFLVYYNNNATLTVSSDKKELLLNASVRDENVFKPAALDENSSAGADLLWAARYSGSASYIAFNPDSHMYKLMGQTATLAQRGGEARAAKILAGVAGSSVPAMGTAQRDAFRAQMLRMRDHTGLIGLNPGYAYEDTPFYHAWVEATGHFAEQSADGLLSGYRLNSWGGSVGMDMDVDNTTSLGLAITALYGDLKAGNADSASGKLDGYYLSFMGRFQTQRWAHTLVATVGINQAKLDRTVNYETGSYTTNGSTSGNGYGLMYEVTYAIMLDEEGTSILEPLFNASIMRTTLRDYKESGERELGLNVGKQEWSTASFAIGARWTTEIGEEAFDRSAQLELRANISQDVGDNQGETQVALQVNPDVARKVKGAAVGKTALQLGAALRAPLDEQNEVYMNASADLRSGMTSWNLSLGWRHDF